MPFQAHTKKMFAEYAEIHDDIRLKSVLGFESLFRQYTPSATAPGYEFVEITTPESLDHVHRGKGLYMIASDFVPALDRRDACSLKIEGLSVIYRGQADLVRERVKSHLDNTRYVRLKREKAQSPWTRCIKLDKSRGNGGIDFDAAPFKAFRWVVLVLPLPNSTSDFRNCAEWGFDAVFGKPLASNERASGPSPSALDEARIRFAPG